MPAPAPATSTLHRHEHTGLHHECSRVDAQSARNVRSDDWGVRSALWNGRLSSGEGQVSGWRPATGAPPARDLRTIARTLVRLDAIASYSTRSGAPLTAHRQRLPLHVASITDVAERQLCTGCGVCAYVQPDDIEMVDDVDAGRRPIVRSSAQGPHGTDEALAACPGIGLSHDEPPPGVVESVRKAWGPVLEVWEGHATDPEIRFSGSSGGAATALALHGLRARGMHGVLHIRARDDLPYLNETTFSTSREALLAAIGSRYAPASPCDRLDLVRDAPNPSVFIGKPCDVAATAKARARDPRLDEKLGLTIAIFCAGTPTTRGTFEMLRAMGIEDPDRITNVRYRGNGWPGKARAEIETDDGSVVRELSYEESWGHVLQRHRQWRCYVCADHTGEFADIAVGDPWYREIEEGEHGESLLLARTERGRDFLRSAVSEGVIDARPVAADRIPASQPGLLKVRGSVWGRVAASRLAGVPAPRYRMMPTFPVWLKSLSFADKLRSTLGLLRRIPRKGLRKRHAVVALETSTRSGRRPPR